MRPSAPPRLRRLSARVSPRVVVLGGLLLLTFGHLAAVLSGALSRPGAGARAAGMSAEGLSEILLVANLLGAYLFILTSEWLHPRRRSRTPFPPPADDAGTGTSAGEALSADAAAMVKLAYTDELTGLPNRRRFEQKLDAMLAAHRQASRPFTLGLIDLDGFKPLNEVYGMAAGDDILKQAALRLEGAASEHGFLARVGGDEFALIAPGLTDEESVRTLGGVLSEVLSAPYDLGRRKVRLSGCFGFAIAADASSKAPDLLSRANLALDQARAEGRGRISIFSKALENALHENARIEDALRGAIARNAIVPYFQPIVDLRTEAVLGFEALARWDDEALGSIPPAKFIPMAEKSGLIGELTDLLLHQAASEALHWPANVFLSFNLSTAQLSDPLTGLKLLSTLSGAGLDPRRLEVEITETAVMSDPKTAEEIIAALRQAGVRVALDDFGTGHSSLGYLRQLTLDKVKIDRSFVMGIGREKQSDHIVKAILEMCAGLELKVVAEGIEERRQIADLRRFGCAAGQGYLFGRPMNAVGARDFVRRSLARPQAARN